MHDTNDGVLALLQDIKEMLHGIVLILTGMFLCVVSAWWGSGWAVLLALAGLIVLIAGLAYAHHGYNRHEVVEKQD